MKPEYLAEIVAVSNRVDGGTVAVSSPLEKC